MTLRDAWIAEMWATVPELPRDVREADRVRAQVRDAALCEDGATRGCVNTTGPLGTTPSDATGGDAPLDSISPPGPDAPPQAPL